MLKIKDSVILKELEKFGFKKWNSTFLSKYAYVWDNYRKSTLRIVVYKDYKLRTSNIDSAALDILYDLIKADIVEKVEE